MANRARSSVLLISMIAVVFAGCDNSGAAPLVTAPNAPTSPTPVGAWKVDGAIVKADGRCFRTVVVGRTFSEDWSVYVAGTSIWLDEGVQNAPSDDTKWEGTVDRLQFTATPVGLPPIIPRASDPCSLGVTSDTLSGTFNATYTAFEATRTVTLTFKSEPDPETQTIDSHLVGAKR